MIPDHPPSRIRALITMLASPVWRVIKALKKIFRNISVTFCAATERTYCLLLNRRKNFRYELAVAGIFKNEGPFLEEWLTLHRAVGVDHFYLYNNDSTDGFREVLGPWISKGLVTLFEWPGTGGQRSAYNHCIRRFRSHARWIAFLDVDEFLFSPENQDLRKVLPRYQGAAAIFVHWVLFGSNGHMTPPEGSVIEAYTRCLDLESARNDAFDHKNNHYERDLYVTGWAKDGKSITNPRLIKNYYVHKPEEVWSGKTVDEKMRTPMQRVSGYADISCDILRINHYWSKSIQDITRKVERGNACWVDTPSQRLERWLDRESHLNKTEDKTLLELWERIRREK